MWLMEFQVFSLKLATFPSLDNYLPIVGVLLRQVSSYEIDALKINITRFRWKQRKEKQTKHVHLL